IPLNERSPRLPTSPAILDCSRGLFSKQRPMYRGMLLVAHRSSRARKKEKVHPAMLCCVLVARGGDVDGPNSAPLSSSESDTCCTDHPQYRTCQNVPAHHAGDRRRASVDGRQLANDGLPYGVSASSTAGGQAVSLSQAPGQ